MKNTYLSSSKTAIILAIVNSILLLLLIISFDSFNSYINSLSLVLVLVSAFVFVSYFLNVLILERLIGKKIDRIYGIMISNTDDSKTKKSLLDIEKEIGHWVESKSSEISRLKEMESYRKEFIGNVSHELKTPIFIAQSYIETLLDGSLKDNKVNRKHLKKTLKSILRLSQITKDLEMISQLEKGVLELNKSNFKISNLIRDVVEFLEVSAEKENVHISVEYLTNSDYTVFADEEKIDQVLSNLITNAIKYNSENGYVKLNCKELGRHYQIEIKDNGLGINDEDKVRIFERFYRIDKGRSREKGGTGLGLSIVKHILEAHNQSIQVESELGKGTIFRFTLEKGVIN